MEIWPKPEESSNAVIVQVDVHHRHCSQLSPSVATTNHVCVNETQATSDVSSIHPGYPKTAAERMREYRARKKKGTLTVNHQKQKRSAAERAKEYIIQQKMKIHSGDSTMEISPNPEESSNAVTVPVDVHHRHCSQLSASVATTSHVCVNETQATSDVSSIHTGYPKTAAERMREYRARKKKETLTVNHQKQKRSAAERAKEYIIQQKMKIHSGEIDISNVELQIKEEREDPEDNLEIEIEIPSLKLNMVMEHEDEIQEIIKIEENNFQCQICLSVGRRMFPLEEYKEIYKKLLFDNYQDREENWLSTGQVCWECHAVLRSVDRFQRKVRTAHYMLQSHQNDVSLSTLTTVVFSDSNPETIYLIEADKQTDQLNSETDTDNPEANELLIERKIVERKPKFKVIEGVEIFKRLDYDLNDLREVLDERRNVESYKRSRFKCSTCILSFDDENELNEHNRECHDEKIGTHVCDICQCRFSERTQLVSHSRSHFSEFYCRLCSYRCSSEENRDRHGRTHGRPTECLECGQLFGNHCQFNHHYKKSHETFACDHCGLTFKMKLSLVEHISKRHKKSKHKICDKGFHGPSSESAYCEECDLQFTDIYRYKLHLANSVKHKPKQTVRFPCPECLKGFATKSNLKNHYESFHLKLIKFKCVDCDKYFGRNTDLTRHRRKCHDNVRPPKN